MPRFSRLTSRVQTINKRDPARLFPHDRLFNYIIIPFIPRWVSPNQFTILRFLLTPFVLWLLVVGNYPVGIPLFLFAAFTDALDGSLARVRGQITTWGMFYDPVADKLLIGSVVLLVVMKHINIYFGLTILLIEALIVGGGYAHKRQGKVMSANLFGKIKMVLQVIGVLFLLFALSTHTPLLIQFSIATFVVAIAFALVSFFTYGL